MKTLPLPDLHTAAERLKHWLAPLLEPAALDNTAKALELFIKRDGEDLYTALKAMAEAKAPDSWLADLWRRQFLLQRDSLPLTPSNLTLKINWHAPQTGLKRAAHFVIAMAHLHHLYSTTPEEIRARLKKSGRNPDEMCLGQWDILRGALRRPAAKKDEFIIREPDDGGDGSIIILYRGHAWRIILRDDKGVIATPAQLENVLYDLLQHTLDNNTIPFAAPSVLPVEQALEVRTQLMCRDENNRIMQAVQQAWFIVSLDDSHYRDEGEACFNAAFGQGDGYWARKPLNYCLYLKDDRFFAHFDQSIIDPAAMTDMLALGQTLHDEMQRFSRKNTLPDHLGLTPLEWTIDGRRSSGNQSMGGEIMEGTYAMLYEALGEFRHRSEMLMVSLYDLFMTGEERRLLAPYNLAAIINILLQYAQLTVYGEIRHSCEILDMRHFQNGRTDIIATLSRESTACAQALAEHRMNVRQLEQAVDAYNARVRLSRNGGGINGFWLAMQYIAEVQGIQPDLLTDPGVKILRHPFISIIEAGKEHGAGKVIFAPPQEDGMAISYSAGRNYCDFVITHRRNKINEIEKFTRAIGSGLKQILPILRAAQE